MILNTVTETAIRLPFKFTPQGGVAFSTDQATIWSNRVLSAVGTSFTERVMRSDYGADISRDIWGTISELKEDLPNRVAEVFSAALPTLILEDVLVDFDPETNLVTATIEYTLPNQDTLTTQVGVATIAGNQLLYEENK